MVPPPLIAVEKLTAPPAGSGGAPVLRDVDFAVHRGERIVLMGPSGSGKSTLLRCMVLLDPADGTLRLDGDPVGPDRARTLRRRVGYLPQRPVGIAGTIAENLSFPRDLVSKARIPGGRSWARQGAGTGALPALGKSEQRALLGRLGLGDVDQSRRFTALSGGEQQRFALVRSMSACPDVLLLDEPTASLDPENVGAVLELLEEWVSESETRALVWVSHQAHEVRDLGTRRVTMAQLNEASA